MSELYRFIPAPRAIGATAFFCAAGFVFGFLVSLLVAAPSLLWAIG